MRQITLLLCLCILSALAHAQSTPSIDPQATITLTDGTTEENNAYSGSAPVQVQFAANATDTTGWTCHYEWHFYLSGNRSNPYLVRYGDNTEYTFTQSGTHNIELYATFVNGTDTVAYTDDYWTSEGTPITITVSESSLNMPNAFSPNGDGVNDIYRAKTEYKSIIQFHAYIFNRWGQKLFEWTDPAEGWDGTYKGHAVKDGVYYCLVKAKGADGRIFNIRTDVNLIR